MSTLGDMKARIAEEIFRDDLGTAIAREITSAIRFYQSKRIYFQERYDFVFDTEPGQAFYGAADAPEIANLISIDFVAVSYNGSITTLNYRAPDVLEQYTTPPSSGYPYNYTYYESQLRLYPVPMSVLPVRVAGLITKPAPGSDLEDGNPWMNDAEELIRARTKRNLYLHSLGDQGMGAVMKALEDEALDALRTETSMRTQVDRLMPSECF